MSVYVEIDLLRKQQSSILYSSCFDICVILRSGSSTKPQTACLKPFASSGTGFTNFRECLRSYLYALLLYCCAIGTCSIIELSTNHVPAG